MKELTLTPADNLQMILDGLSEPATIYLKRGIYRVKLRISADDVTIIGEDRETTVITFDDYARKIHADGKEYNTFRTYTACVTGERVKLCNLTIENSNTRPEQVGQCVALSVNARTFFARNLHLRSTQDTLFLAPFPDDLTVRYRGFIPRDELYMEGTSLHLFDGCRISGTVDFIFGGAEAYFKNCEIVSLNDARDVGYLAAPCHHLVQEEGFTFLNCNLTGYGVRSATVFLARPWRDYGKCTFLHCKVGDHIKPELFDKWNDTDRDKTARFSYFGLDCDFEPDCVPWAKELSKAEAETIISRCEEKFKAFNK